jgi:hypothetical protein
MHDSRSAALYKRVRRFRLHDGDQLFVPVAHHVGVSRRGEDDAQGQREDAYACASRG